MKCLRQDQLGTDFPLGLAGEGHCGEVDSGGKKRLGTALAAGAQWLERRALYVVRI